MGLVSLGAALLAGSLHDRLAVDPPSDSRHYDTATDRGQ